MPGCETVGKLCTRLRIPLHTIGLVMKVTELSAYFAAVHPMRHLRKKGKACNYCAQCATNLVSQLESTRLVTNHPVSYRVSLLLSIRRIALLGKWPTPLSKGVNLVRQRVDLYTVLRLLACATQSPVKV
jgi:hypothetical protein